MIEKRLERVPTMLRDRRRPARGHHCRKKLQLRASTTAADSKRDARAALKVELTISGVPVDVALDGRADLSYQVLSPAVHQGRQSQHIAADQQPENLRCDQTCAPVRFLGRQVVARQDMTDDFEGEELADRSGQGLIGQGGADRRHERRLKLGVPDPEDGSDESLTEIVPVSGSDLLEHPRQPKRKRDRGEEELLLAVEVVVDQGRIHSGFSRDPTHRGAGEALGRKRMSGSGDDLAAGVLVARPPANFGLSLDGHCSSSTQAFAQHLRRTPSLTGSRVASGSVGRRADPASVSMIDALAYVVVALAAVATIWGVVTAVANKPPGKAQLLFAAGVEVVTVIQSIIAAAKLAAGFRPVELATTIGYLIGIVILIPIAWLWANAERNRFSGIVLAVAALAVLAMTLRLLVLWTPAS